MTADIEPGTYICLTCERLVDADLEPSPGEPMRCADCQFDVEREVRWSA